MWKQLLALVVAVGIVSSGVSVYLHRHQLFRTSFTSVGGTVLLLELQAPATRAAVERACEVLTKRFNPYGSGDVIVRPEGKDHISISVPNGPSHDDIVNRVRRLAASRGRVEFRVLANFSEDRDAMLAAEKQFRATKDEVPVSPDDTAGGKEVVIGKGVTARHYRWFRLVEDQAVHWIGHTGSLGAPGKKEVYPNIYRNMNVFVYRPAAGRPSYFVLARKPADDERIGGEGINRVHVTNAVRTSHGNFPHSLLITFDQSTAQKLLVVSGRNVSPGFSHGPDVKFMAVILDGAVFTSHMLATPVQRTAIFGVWGNTTDAEDQAALLQGGELPVKLMALPADVRIVPPGGK